MFTAPFEEPMLGRQDGSANHAGTTPAAMSGVAVLWGGWASPAPRWAAGSAARLQPPSRA